MVKKRKIWSFILSLMLVLSITITFSFIGCKEEAAPAEEEVAEEAAPAEEEVAEEAAPAEEEVAEEAELKVGNSEMNSGWPWFASMREQFELRCAEKGWDGISLSAGGDVATQVAQIEDFISMGVDYLLVSPLDSNAVAPGLEKAYEKGIKVINVTNLIDEIAFPYCVAIRVPNDVELARVSTEIIVEALDGKGGIVVVDGYPGTTGNNLLWQGINEALEGTEVEVLESEPAYWDPTQAITVTEGLLTKHPDADGVYCTDAAMTSGVLQVVEEFGYEGIVVGCAGTASEKEAIKAGTLYGTCAKSPKVNIDDAIAVIEQLEAGKDVEFLVYCKTMKVTTENVDEMWGDW